MKSKRSKTVGNKMNKKKSLWSKVVQNKVLLFMCLPAIIFFITFSYLPLPGAYIAFTNFNYRAGIFKSPFVGFDNFEFLFKSGKLWMLTKNAILYNLAFIILGNVLQLFVAILINEIRSKYFKKVSQTIMFLPYFISAVLVSLLVYGILNYDYGYINTILKSFGNEPVKFYAMPQVWPIIIVIVWLWQQTGYGSIVYFAAICGIDTSIVEAARVDGASELQRIRYITLPHLKPTVIMLFLFALGGIIRGNFGLFYNLTGKNPLLYPTTDIIETFVYRALMNNFDFTSASAVGLYQSVFGFVIVMLSNWLVRRIDDEYALF